MPITGRTLGEAARKFCEHVNRVLATTVTQTRLVRIGLPNPKLIHITFRQAGQLTTATLHTRFGRMGLYLGQVCSSTVKKKQHQLLTVSYRYTLTPEGAAEPLFRWEYERQPSGLWCRHHLQGDVLLQVGGTPVSLNALHLPTGYVTIEEVLRFCIVDLGVEPLREDWDQTLRESYRRFKTEFSP